jgi:hypothetical protein
MLSVGPGHASNRVGVCGQIRAHNLLGLRWATEALAKQHLDRADPRSYIGNMHLGPVLLATVWTGERCPVLTRRRDRCVGQRALDLLRRGCSRLREQRPNLGRG